MPLTFAEWATRNVEWIAHRPQQSSSTLII
jgi:hypothetical protein